MAVNARASAWLIALVCALALFLVRGRFSIEEALVEEGNRSRCYSCQRRLSSLEIPLDGHPRRRFTVGLKRPGRWRTTRSGDLELRVEPAPLCDKAKLCDESVTGKTLHTLEAKARFIQCSAVALGQGYILTSRHCPWERQRIRLELVGAYREFYRGRAHTVRVPPDQLCIGLWQQDGRSDKGEDWVLYHAPKCSFLAGRGPVLQARAPGRGTPLELWAHAFGRSVIRSPGISRGLRTHRRTHVPLLDTKLETWDGASGGPVWADNAIVGIMRAGFLPECCACTGSCWGPVECGRGRCAALVQPIGSFLGSVKLHSWCRARRRRKQPVPRFCPA